MSRGATRTWTEVEPMLDATTIAKMLGVSTKTVLAWSEKGRFPQPHNFGVRVHRWLREDVEAFLTAARPRR